jgi:hypothetical protein
MIFTQIFLIFVQQFIAIDGAIKHFQMEDIQSRKVPSWEWLEFEGGVISALFQPTESALSRRWRSAMKTDTTKATADAAEGTLFLGDDWFDPLEAGVRAFAASLRNSWKLNSTSGTGINGLGLPRPA